MDLSEGRATGISKIFKEMAANGSPEPLFESDDRRCSFVIRLPVHAEAQATSPASTMEVSAEVAALLVAIDGELSRQSLQEKLGLKHAEHFRKTYLPWSRRRSK